MLVVGTRCGGGFSRQRLGVRRQRCKGKALHRRHRFRAAIECSLEEECRRADESAVALRFPPHSRTLSHIRRLPFQNGILRLPRMKRCFLLLASCFIVASAHARTWTEAASGRKIEAEFVSADGVPGSRFSVPG